MLEQVFREHLRLSLDGMLLFAVGLFVSWPVVRYRLKAVSWLPLKLLGAVLKLFGPAPRLPRIAAVIFCFNTCTLFVCLLSGFHPVLPKLFGIATGMNMGIVLGLGRHEEKQASLLLGRAPGWNPPAGLSRLCGVLVLLIEMPSLWFTIAMGIGLGQRVQGGVAYLEALRPRALTYLLVVAPALLLSAVAEAIAIRGASARGR